MTTFFNTLKLFITIPIQLVAGLVMLCSIILFGLATLIDSPKIFSFKCQVLWQTLKNIIKDTKEKIILEKYKT